MKKEMIKFYGSIFTKNKALGFWNRQNNWKEEPQ